MSHGKSHGPGGMAVVGIILLVLAILSWLLGGKDEE